MAQEISGVVGIIGIGQLGSAIASNLLDMGYRVVGYRRNRNEAQAFVDAGGELVDTPSLVVQQADFIFLCLPNESASNAVLEGVGGILPLLKDGKTVVEVGTYRKSFKLMQAEKIQATGANILEAELSGSPSLVLARKACFYVGGTDSVYEKCEPLLQAITDNRFFLGAFGTAVSMKLIANYLVTVNTLAAAEAMNLGTRAGFSPDLLARVLSVGAGASAMMSVRAPIMASRKFEPAPGSFITLEKYLDLGQELVSELGCSAPLYAAAVPYFRRAIEQGLQNEDIAAVIKLLEAESQGDKI
ncbi:NAD binding domain of 6-phosphogluconate dehydrogenase family protein [Paraburkholderia xenovorans LB400]|uniref:Dehydrogenase/oxidoreductase protein n=3 Tax=Burkholderiales TaxID=80840 RepID=Q13VQ8_PARXL|nr:MULTISPECIES: NAD(P)-dependent oxidoreductase [Pseudomonadota]ABE31831.1 Putative dehydrogenase/oxidoreductase protein [Paraburkholderia xenovorans LB400]ADP19857.1 3-hydroxyisobutyrate dehydrogenase 2 [Achromobacter xylosoxidans A8]AIP31434.1 NAD binding domain of 6-phosphogluconate dehydrogenase family protein [Paraburkholderia xenovorans LB400]MBC2768827.1 NAD(P)-dependent oxidoreductase [Pusillimonas minor]